LPQVPGTAVPNSATDSSTPSHLNFPVGTETGAEEVDVCGAELGGVEDVVVMTVLEVEVVVGGWGVVVGGWVEVEVEAAPGWHWEYQSLTQTQWYPDTQDVFPVKPVPPHCCQAWPFWADTAAAKSATES
jgi:hypothetical protein